MLRMTEWCFGFASMFCHSERALATEESLLTISASVGEILSDAQNDSGCVFVGVSYFAKLQFISANPIYLPNILKGCRKNLRQPNFFFIYYFVLFGLCFFQVNHKGQAIKIDE